MATRKRRGEFADLDEYDGCQADGWIGITPLAVGWLRRDREYEQGQVPPQFIERLQLHCQPGAIVCQAAAPRPCPLCGLQVPDNGAGQIRIIGVEEIYAAPDLIHHFVSVHHYRPPKSFIQDVLRGPLPDTPEHQALRRAYR